MKRRFGFDPIANTINGCTRKPLQGAYDWSFRISREETLFCLNFYLETEIERISCGGIVFGNSSSCLHFGQQGCLILDACPNNGLFETIWGLIISRKTKILPLKVPMYNFKKSIHDNPVYKTLVFCPIMRGDLDDIFDPFHLQEPA